MFLGEWVEVFKERKGWELTPGTDTICVRRHRCTKYHKAGRYDCPRISKQEMEWDEWAVGRILDKRSKSNFCILAKEVWFFLKPENHGKLGAST